MKYIVVKRFRDLKDNLTTYNENEQYPRKGTAFNKKRVAELVNKGFIIIDETKETEEKVDGEKI